MPARLPFSIPARSFVSTVISAVFLFALGSIGPITFAGAHSSPEIVPNAAVPSLRFSTFDEEPDNSVRASERRECAALADVRWLPHSTVKISYARGQFTEKERGEFHRAISLWQKALLEMKLGIVLEEHGEIENDAEPSSSQIIVKRDYSMGSRHYGKIVAATRPDNYLDRAYILINGSLTKRSSLRKTMLHELGHAFGLKDCFGCRSGTTVMNYFSQQSMMGLNIGKAGRKISDKPSRCDLAAVAVGYGQSQPALANNSAAESQLSRNLVADEIADAREAAQGTSDNIITQYLTAISFKQTNELSLGVFFKQTAYVYKFAPGAYSGRAVTHRTEEFGGGPFFKVASTVGRLGLMIPPLKPAPAEKYVVSLPSSNLNAASVSVSNVNAEPPSPAAMPATETKTISVGPRNPRVLTDAEKIEFDSYIPTLLGKEAETMGELNNYSFTRDVRIQTIDNKGCVSGEYRRTSELVFDDSGQRIERGLELSKSSLRRLKISPEYVEDFSGVQLKGFELSKRDHYRIEPFMTETVNGIRMRVYRMTPLNLNAERATQTRVFYGYVWAEENTGRIVKIGGLALPDGKQRFPLFETERALVDGKHLFPVHTIADDYLVFSSHRIHVRMLITYSNYKRFESRVKIIEVDD